MRLLLVMLCGLMVVVTTLIAIGLLTGAGYDGIFQTSPGGLLFAGIAALNVAAIAAVLGKTRHRPWVFYTLAGLDAVVFLIVGLMWIDFGLNDSEINVMGGILLGGFGAKGLLSFFHAWDRDSVA